MSLWLPSRPTFHLSYWCLVHVWKEFKVNLAVILLVFYHQEGIPMCSRHTTQVYIYFLTPNLMNSRFLWHTFKCRASATTPECTSTRGEVLSYRVVPYQFPSLVWQVDGFPRYSGKHSMFLNCSMNPCGFTFCGVQVSVETQVTKK